MKRLVSMAAVGLSMVLLMPLGVAAQAESDEVKEVPDPVGDLLGTVGPLQTEAVKVEETAPAYLDVTLLRLAVDGEDLVVTFEVAGDIPERDSTLQEAMYRLGVEYGGDDTFMVETRQSEDWTVSLTKFRRVPDESSRPVWTSAHGDAELSGDHLTMRIPLAELGGHDQAQFFAYSGGARDCSSSDPCELSGSDADVSEVRSVQWVDVVPNDLVGDRHQGFTWTPGIPGTSGQSPAAASAVPGPASPEDAPGASPGG